MDPPYEPYQSFMAWNLRLLQFLSKWPSACARCPVPRKLASGIANTMPMPEAPRQVAVWYPCLDGPQLRNLYQGLSGLGMGHVLVVEFGCLSSTR